MAGVTSKQIHRNFISNLGSSMDPAIVSLDTVLAQLLDLQKRVTTLEELATGKD
jgi:hypothetical protein